MRGRGMTYDTGFIRGDSSSREHFDPWRVEKELAVIRDDLNCNAVHIVGGDPDRLEIAAHVAAELGMEVWFSPYPLEQTTDQILTLFATCAERAERLRAQGAEIVFVAGVELSVMNRGFIDGDDVSARLERLLTDPEGRDERFAELGSRLNAFLGTAVAHIRERFQGPVTYAAIQFEAVDWDLFDIVTLELIRSAAVADIFRSSVRSLVAQQPKPVAITGFGTATWRGAGDMAPRSMEIIENDPDTGAPVRLSGVVERDEDGQATYLHELLEVFDSEGVDSAFVFLFALDNLPHRPDGDPRDDLDLASLGIVKVFEGRNGVAYPQMPWEPKAAFGTIAEFYRR
ncbi:hypothetical protein EEB19_24405 [Gordonia sp. OPL2]|nr:hypothetical protein EEB19_24405 [Gordonia sp. OPL2]